MAGQEVKGNMRIAFVGASQTAVRTAEFLIKHSHEVIIIDSDEKKVDGLREELDCSFLPGDGSKPEILREVDPEHTDVLFCLSNDDKDNLIASLVGRSLGFKRVVTRVEDPEFEPICRGLGLKDIIVPSLTISHYLQDLIRGVDVVKLSTILKDQARFFSFTARGEDAVAVSELNLPPDARVICYYRDGELAMADPETKLLENDEVVVLTNVRILEKLEERWKPKSRAQEKKQ
jgi:trk/ktr system potassium uptake protein